MCTNLRIVIATSAGGLHFSAFYLLMGARFIPPKPLVGGGEPGDEANFITIQTTLYFNKPDINTAKMKSTRGIILSAGREQKNKITLATRWAHSCLTLF